MTKGIKIPSCFASCMLHAAVMVRESDKCHFHRHPAVSEDQGASCLALMCLLLREKRRGKCSGSMSFTSTDLNIEAY